MKMYITYPKSIKSDTFCFKLNTDDYPCHKEIDKHLKSLGITFKRTRQQHKTRCIGWHVYKIKADKPIQSFDENIEFVESLFSQNNRKQNLKH